MRALVPVLGLALLPLSSNLPAAGETAPPEPPAAAVVDVDAARDGLAAWLLANRPASPSTSTDLAGCPAVELDDVEAALASGGLAGGLGDWGTEIEWDEYEDIDRNLMGVVCAGDADGDVHDSAFELAAGVVAVDAGSDERAISVIAGLGFGALDVADADVAGVPGGELTTGCIDDGGLSACLTFWNHDGLVIGTTLWSDARRLPAGSSHALLEALLPAILGGLADHAGTAPEPPASTATDGTEAPSTPVDAARSGLERVLGGRADTPPDAPLETCLVADVATVDAALETAGVDTPLAGWGQWIGPLTDHPAWPQRAIVCEGAYRGTGDPSFPELTFRLAVADLGDDVTLGAYLTESLGIAVDEEPLSAPAAGGATIGRCVRRDRTDDCYEVWTDGRGFAVMVHVQDQTSFDRPTASAVLDRLVPDVLAALGGRATAIGDELAGVDPGLVEAAAAGLDAFVESATATSALDCPAATVEDVAAALDGAGVDGGVEGWAARLDELESTNGAAPATRLTCSDRASLVTLDVIDFTDPVDADEFVASVGLAEGGAPADLEPGAVVVGSCTTVSGQEYCNAWWRDGTLVVGVTLFADADVITRNDAGEVLTTLVPTAVDALAALAG